VIDSKVGERQRDFGSQSQAFLQLKKGPPKTLAQQHAVGIQFRDPKATDTSKHDAKIENTPEDDDEQYARRLQAKLDAAEYAHNQRGCAALSLHMQSIQIACDKGEPPGVCRGMKQPKGQPYIKISEEEIADDYPMPMQYEMQEEEIDEFVVNGAEDMMLDVDPECLPKLVHSLPCVSHPRSMCTSCGLDLQHTLARTY
jgi:hypothetical protein